MILNRMLLIIIAFCSSMTWAQKDYLESTSGGVQVRIGIVGDYEGADLSSVINQGIAKDLKWDGRFQIYNAKSVESTWSSLGVQYYTTAKWTEVKLGEYTLDLNLSDFYSGEGIFGRRYEIKKTQLPSAIHDFSDEVIRNVFGMPGLNSTQILFVKKIAGSKNIFKMNIQGDELTQITKGEGIRTFPKWGPNLGSIIYTAFDEGIPSIYQMRFSDYKARRLLPAGVKGITPSLSKQGSAVIYSEQGDASSDLYEINLSDGTRKRITSSNGNELSPDFDENTNGVYFTWDRGMSPQIYFKNPEGELKRLTYNGNYNESAAISPRGDKMAYCTMNNGLLDILVQNLRTKEIMQLTYLQGNNESPSWSPDGRFLSFSSTRNGEAQIFIMREDGTGVVQITNNGINIQPRWSGFKNKQE